MNIMIVDDDKSLLRSLEILLGQRGHKVVVFSNIKDATDYFLKGEFVDIFLVDYFIAGTTGKDFLEATQASILSRCVTILMSAHIDHIDYTALRKLGVDDIMAKPLDLEELNQVIAAM